VVKSYQAKEKIIKLNINPVMSLEDQIHCGNKRKAKATFYPPTATKHPTHPDVTPLTLSK
jgi:hypothetical protein